MKLRALTQFLLLFSVTLVAVAQQSNSTDSAVPSLSFFVEVSPASLALPENPPPLPRMSPDLAIQTYQANAKRQLTSIGTSSDMTIVEAQIPTTGQKGRFELRRSFMAPKSLAYGTIKFVGDTFIKTNIITKLLQSEVEHVEKGDSPNTAITADNYKFNYKGPQTLNGQPAYEFHVKPRKKKPGLFKGKIYLDATTGHIVRAEGTLVKSPSVFVKKVDFVQDYEDVAGFTLPLHMHSLANTRLFGKAVVDISHSDYSVAPTTADAASGVIFTGPLNH